MQPLDEKHRQDLARRLDQPLTIGSKSVANRLWLAPLAGLSHVAFREVLDGYGGCGLMFTEMCGAKSAGARPSCPVWSARWRAPPRSR
jgi:hypothetical protein